VKKLFGMMGLLIVLCIGYYLHFGQIKGAANGTSTVQQANLVAVKRDLLSLAQSQRLYLASEGRYATLDELRHSNIMNMVPEGNRSGYVYVVDVDGAAHFCITAKPADSSRTGLPTFSIDETMQIKP
jgi:hypothetical protein